ncbi:hypothetical protein MY11210_006169 [Beauveria gryllotalpidicola]
MNLNWNSSPESNCYMVPSVPDGMISIVQQCNCAQECHVEAMTLDLLSTTHA